MTTDDKDSDGVNPLNETLHDLVRMMIETSPFSTENWTENNGRPREW